MQKRSWAPPNSTKISVWMPNDMYLELTQLAKQRKPKLSLTRMVEQICAQYLTRLARRKTAAA